VCGAPQHRSCMLEEGKSRAPHCVTNFLLVLPLHLTLYSSLVTLLPPQASPLPCASITTPVLPPSHSWLRLCLLYRSTPPTSSIAPRYDRIMVSFPSPEFGASPWPERLRLSLSLACALGPVRCKDAHRGGSLGTAVTSGEMRRHTPPPSAMHTAALARVR
jgi:hypothetical protein